MSQSSEDESHARLGGGISLTDLGYGIMAEIKSIRFCTDKQRVNSSTSRKLVDQAKVILGLLRETIFLQTQFELELGSINESIRAELVDVQETSRRDDTERRVLAFRILSSASDFESKLESHQSALIGLRFGINSYLVKGTTQLLRHERDGKNYILYCDIPPLIEIENARKSRRKKSESRIGVTTVLVRSGNNHTEGVLELTDYSRGGYGGNLRVPSGFKFINDTIVQGVLRIGADSIAIICKIRRAQLILERAEDWDTYSVGLQNEQEESKTRADRFAQERRKSNRTSVQEQVHLIAALNKDFKFRLHVDEASVTGFSGKLANPAHAVEFPIGSSFEMETPPISVTLQGFDGERLRFAINSGSVNDRLEWFKRVSPYLLEGVSHSVFDARDLLEVFCASGSLSTEYLKTQRTHRTDFLSPFEGVGGNSFWSHRWIYHNSRRNVAGHWCSLRLGDNGWMLADLAGSPTKEQKIPSDFTDSFFKSFSEFCTTLAPCPVAAITWVTGHPYWKQFGLALEKSGLIYEKVITGYTRYSAKYSAVQDGQRAFLCKVIPATSHDVIVGIVENLKRNGMYHHASLFDFDVDRFSSPVLTQNFRGINFSFSREYVEFSGQRSKWMAIFSAYPLGGSFNRIPESVWVFPIEGSEGEQREEWPALVVELFAYALTRGIKPSSIRRVTPFFSAVLFPGEQALTENIVFHPNGLKLFNSCD